MIGEAYDVAVALTEETVGSMGAVSFGELGSFVSGFTYSQISALATPVLVKWYYLCQSCDLDRMTVVPTTMFAI
jgi:hypothetical protein